MNPNKNRCRNSKSNAAEQLENEESCKESLGYRYDKPKNKNQEKTSSGMENQASLSDTTLDAVQKSLDHTLRAYFIHTMEKIECLSSQLLRNECTLAKMHLDIIERISKLCDRSLAQYQSLTEQIENRGDKLRVSYYDNNTASSNENSDDAEFFNVTQPNDFTNKMREPQKRDSKHQPLNNFERKNTDLESASDCEERIRNLNHELMCTKLELEECLKRLQQIKAVEEMQRYKQTTSDKILSINAQKEDECNESKLNVPKPPQVPCECECTKKQPNRKAGYGESEMIQSTSRRRDSTKSPVQKSSKPKLQQDYPSPCADKKRQPKS